MDYEGNSQANTPAANKTQWNRRFHNIKKTVNVVFFLQSNCEFKEEVELASGILNILLHPGHPGK